MSKRHLFSRDGLDFAWQDGWCAVYKDGERIFGSIDTHFESDDDVYEFWTFMKRYREKNEKYDSTGD